jgi:hypothetical protein
MWYVLQFLIVFGVGYANIYWELTPNGYAAWIFGMFLAWITTEFLTWLFGLVARTKAALRKEPESSSTSSLRVSRHIGDPLEQRTRLRISKNVS